MTDWLLIFGMMVVTFGPRYLPLALIDRLQLPPALLRTLPYIPIAVLSAIIAQNSAFIDDQLELSFTNHRLLTIVIAIFIALLTRSLFWTVGVGLVVFFILNGLVT